MNHLSFTVVSLQGVCQTDLFHCEPPFFHCCLFTGVCHTDLFHCEPPFFHCCLFTGCLSHIPVSLWTVFFLVQHSMVVLRDLAWQHWWISVTAAGSLWNPRAFQQAWLLWVNAVSVLPGIGSGLQNMLFGLWACLTWAVDLCMTDQSYFHCCLIFQMICFIGNHFFFSCLFTKEFITHVLPRTTVFWLVCLQGSLSHWRVLPWTTVCWLSVYRGVCPTEVFYHEPLSFDCLFTGEFVPLTCFSINPFPFTVVCFQGSSSHWHVFPWTIVFLLLSVSRGVCPSDMFFHEPFSFYCCLFPGEFVTLASFTVNHFPFAVICSQGSLPQRHV